jgi:formylglycine-generating enzyme required for sulfatase activity
LFSYSIHLPKAGNYEFTAHVCTVTVDRQCLLRVNRRTLVDVDIPYTKANWMDTEPVELDLKEGRNRIQYTHYAPNKGVSIKNFTLKPVKMVVGTSGLAISSAGAGQNEIGNTIGVKMVRIGPGSLMMGSTTGPGDERPAHHVKLTKGFYMGATEVTQAQWESVMPNNRSRYKGADRPVENVTLEDCVEFCKLLTQKERTQGKLPEGAEYRLPTEAEWEYACRAGTTSANFSGQSISGKYANFNTRKPGLELGTRKVAQTLANPWGFYDMPGNRNEWCSDIMGEYPAAPVTDPMGLALDDAKGITIASRRVLRGGQSGSSWEYVRSAARYGYKPKVANAFRLVLEVEKPSEARKPANTKKSGLP